MTPAVYNFPSQVRGDTITPRTITVLIDSSPADIASAAMNIRDKDDALLHTVTLGISANVITIPEITGTVTATFPLETIYYDIQTTLASGKIRTYVQGKIQMTKDYTYA